MAYRRTTILKKYLNALECEINKEKELGASMCKQLKKGKIAPEYSIEVRGYFKGLRAARELLDKEIDRYEEEIGVCKMDRTKPSEFPTGCNDGGSK